MLPAAPSESDGGGPVLSGAAQQGDTLSVTDGNWDDSPTGFSYSWENCDSSGSNCSPIGGAGSSSYTLQPSDVGSTIVVVVTASNAGGQASATSNSDGPVLPPPPVNSIAPGISGAPQQGATLTASSGSWSNNPMYAYVWKRLHQLRWRLRADFGGHVEYLQTCLHGCRKLHKRDRDGIEPRWSRVGDQRHRRSSAAICPR